MAAKQRGRRVPTLRDTRTVAAAAAAAVSAMITVPCSHSQQAAHLPQDRTHSDTGISRAVLTPQSVPRTAKCRQSHCVMQAKRRFLQSSILRSFAFREFSDKLGTSCACKLCRCELLLVHCCFLLSK